MVYSARPSVPIRDAALAAGPAWARSTLRLLMRLLVAFTTTAAALGGGTPAAAASLELPALEVRRDEEGLVLDFSARFVLPLAVEDALHKGVALHFVAEARLYRHRWYWRDQHVATATRTWRLAWQPLTRVYRVSFGGLSQTYTDLSEAIAALSRSLQWQIGDALAPDDDARYSVEFSYRMDNGLLPRPMQIGIGGQSDWQLAVERKVPVPGLQP